MNKEEVLLKPFQLSQEPVLVFGLPAEVQEDRAAHDGHTEHPDETPVSASAPTQDTLEALLPQNHGMLHCALEQATTCCSAMQCIKEIQWQI